jgi:hypothetical protein
MIAGVIFMGAGDIKGKLEAFEELKSKFNDLNLSPEKTCLN